MICLKFCDCVCLTLVTKWFFCSLKRFWFFFAKGGFVLCSWKMTSSLSPLAYQSVLKNQAKSRKNQLLAKIGLCSYEKQIRSCRRRCCSVSCFSRFLGSGLHLKRVLFKQVCCLSVVESLKVLHVWKYFKLNQFVLNRLSSYKLYMFFSFYLFEEWIGIRQFIWNPSTYGWIIKSYTLM